MAANQNNVHCGKCKKTKNEDKRESWLQCQACLLNYHIDCWAKGLKINDKEERKNILSYFDKGWSKPLCDSCIKNESMWNILQSWESVQNRIADQDTKIKNIEESVVIQSNKFNEALDKITNNKPSNDTSDVVTRLEALEKQINKPNSNEWSSQSWSDVVSSKSYASQANAIVAAVDKESLERKKRDNYIIIKGIKESTSVEEDLKKKEDLDQVLEIIAKLNIEVTEDSFISTTSRIGISEKDKTRPVRIKFKSKQLRDQVIAESINLNKSDETKAYRIDPDRTFQQRQALSALYDEAKRLEADKPKNGRRWIVTGKLEPSIKNVPIRHHQSAV